jgi:hypothetical protein
MFGGYQSGVLDEYLEFFGNDLKGELFVQAKGTGTLLAELMRAENYNGYSMTRSRVNNCVQGANDVHQDVLDLIITTALRHAELDKPTNVGSTIQGVITQVKANIKKFLAGTTGFNAGNSRFSGSPITSTYSGIPSANNAETIVLLLVDMEAFTLNGNSVQVVTPAQITSIYNNIFDPNIKRLLPASSIPNDRSIGNALYKVKLAIRDDLIKYFGIVPNLADLSFYLNSSKRQFFINMLQDELNSNVLAAIRTISTSLTSMPYTQVSVPTAKSFYDNVYAHWADMSKDARDFYRRYVALFAKITDRTLYDTSNNAKRDQSYDSAWVRLTESEIDALFARPSASLNYNNIRLNLMKAPDGQILFGAELPDVPPNSTVWYTKNDSSVECVPNVPADFLRKLYETVYRSTNKANPSVMCDNKVTYSLSGINTNVATRPKKAFNHNLGKFIGAYFKGSHMKQPQQAQSANDNLSLDDYPFLSTVDMVYGKVWTYDGQKNQYYRMENGTRVYYDDSVRGDAKTCYSTYLAGNKPSECPRIINCLIDANPQTLSRCLAMLKDVDLWDAAEDDIRKVGVDMVLLVLQKFGVRIWEDTDINGNRYKEPDSYADWLKDVVDGFSPDVKQAILSNKKLLNYIKGLLTVCRSDSSILNRDSPDVVPNSRVPDYMKALGMKKFKTPISSVSKNVTVSALLNNIPQYTRNDMYNPLLGVSNVEMVSAPFSGLVPFPMSGGNPLMSIAGPLYTRNKIDNLEVNSSSKILENLILSIKSGLQEVGLVMHKDDNERFANALSKLYKYEQQLSTLAQLLNKFVVLARMYRIPPEMFNDSNLTPIKLDQIRNVNDVSNFVANHISEITRNMSNNTDIQSKTGYEIMQILPRYIDQCSQGYQVPGKKNRTQVQYDGLYTN